MLPFINIRTSRTWPRMPKQPLTLHQGMCFGATVPIDTAPDKQARHCRARDHWLRETNIRCRQTCMNRGDIALMHDNPVEFDQPFVIRARGTGIITMKYIRPRTLIQWIPTSALVSVETTIRQFRASNGAPRFVLLVRRDHDGIQSIAAVCMDRWSLISRIGTACEATCAIEYCSALDRYSLVTRQPLLPGAELTLPHHAVTYIPQCLCARVSCKSVVACERDVCPTPINTCFRLRIIARAAVLHYHATNGIVAALTNVETKASHVYRRCIERMLNHRWRRMIQIQQFGVYLSLDSTNQRHLRLLHRQYHDNLMHLAVNQRFWRWMGALGNVSVEPRGPGVRCWRRFVEITSFVRDFLTSNERKSFGLATLVMWPRSYQLEFRLNDPGFTCLLPWDRAGRPTNHWTRMLQRFGRRRLTLHDSPFRYSIKQKRNRKRRGRRW